MKGLTPTQHVTGHLQTYLSRQSTAPVSDNNLVELQQQELHILSVALEITKLLFAVLHVSLNAGPYALLQKW